MNLIKKIAFTFALISYTQLIAQDVNLVELKTSYHVDGVSTYESKLLVPIPIKSNHLLLGYNYAHTKISLIQKVRLNSHLIKLGYSFKLKETSEHKNLFLLLPKNNFESNIKESHWQLGTVFLHTHKVKEYLKWKIGGYYNMELFGPFFVPMFGVEIQVSDELQIKTLLPLNFHLNCKINEKVTSGFSFVGRVSSYWNDPDQNYGEQYLEVLDNALTLYSDIKLFKNTFMRVDAGIMVGRKFDSFKEEDDLNLRISILKFGTRNEAINEKEKSIAPYTSLSMFYRLSK